jgi:hypothetical protein
MKNLGWWLLKEYTVDNYLDIVFNVSDDFPGV